MDARARMQGRPVTLVPQLEGDIDSPPWPEARNGPYAVNCRPSAGGGIRALNCLTPQPDCEAAAAQTAITVQILSGRTLKPARRGPLCLIYILHYCIGVRT